MEKHLYDARVRTPVSLVIAAAAFALLVGGVTLLGQGCAQKTASGPLAKDPPPPDTPPDTPPDPGTPPDPITEPPPPPAT